MFCTNFQTRNEAEEKFPAKVCESCHHSVFEGGIYCCELLMEDTSNNMKGEDK